MNQMELTDARIRERKSLMGLNIEDLRTLCLDGEIKWTLHALKRIRQRNIKSEDVIRCIMTGKIIKQYEDDKPFPSCLIHAKTEDFQHIHVVVSYDGYCLYFITAYRPDADEWEPDYETRKEK